MSNHHNHNHSHSHSHDHAASMTKSFYIGIALNIAFVLVEVVAWIWLSSLALLSDAWHNLSDVASLILALFALYMSRKCANEKYTYGYAKTTILIALVNAVMIFVAMGIIGYEAVQRLHSPHVINGWPVAWVALVGIIINAGTALLFMNGKDKDINIKGAYVHMAADAAVSLWVVVAGVIMLYTGLYWIDTVLSLIIMVVIFISTRWLLRDSLRLSLDGVPSHINTTDISSYLHQIPGVTSVHDLHIWAMSTTEVALTAHLVIPSADIDAIIKKVKADMHAKFEINHITIQAERIDLKDCCE